MATMKNSKGIALLVYIGAHRSPAYYKFDEESYEKALEKAWCWLNCNS